MTKIVIDQQEFEVENLSEKARKIVASLQFVEEELLRRRNMLAVCDTARIGYGNALMRELQSSDAG